MNRSRFARDQTLQDRNEHLNMCKVEAGEWSIILKNTVDEESELRRNDQEDESYYNWLLKKIEK